MVPFAPPARARLPLAALAGLLMLGLAGVTPAAAAPGGGALDALVAAVPRVDSILVLDHAALRKHVFGVSVRGLLKSRGWGRALSAFESVAGADAAGLTWSVSFRSTRPEAALLAGKLPSAAALRAKAKAKLGDAFRAGEQAGRAWFTLTPKALFAPLGPGRAVVGQEQLVKAALDVAAGQGKALAKRGGFRAMAKAARRKGAWMWSVTWIPSWARKRLTKRGAKDVAAVRKAIFSVSGDGALDLRATAYTKTADEAQAFATGLRSKIDRNLKGSALLRAAGVAALGDQVKIQPKGSRTNISLRLSQVQAALGVSFGAQILSMVR